MIPTKGVERNKKDGMKEEKNGYQIMNIRKKNKEKCKKKISLATAKWFRNILESRRDFWRFLEKEIDLMHNF